jgi:hypothetical protein
MSRQANHQADPRLQDSSTGFAARKPTAAPPTRRARRCRRRPPHVGTSRCRWRRRACWPAAQPSAAGSAAAPWPAAHGHRLARGRHRGGTGPSAAGLPPRRPGPRRGCRRANAATAAPPTRVQQQRFRGAEHHHADDHRHDHLEIVRTKRRSAWPRRVVRVVMTFSSRCFPRHAPRRGRAFGRRGRVRSAGAAGAVSPARPRWRRR